jgi:hypothetical protein
MASTSSEKEKKVKPKAQPAAEFTIGAQISLVRKIIIGLLIVGYWVFFYWFQES